MSYRSLLPGPVALAGLLLSLIIIALKTTILLITSIFRGPDMLDNSNIIIVHNLSQADPYLASGSRLTTQLLRHRLINSFFPLTSGEKLYPFMTPDQLLSSRGNAWVEHWHQRSVLMFLIDCRLPRPPNKHFSLRISNRVT